MKKREYERSAVSRPILASSAAVFGDGRALIIRQARALLDHFSLPDGGSRSASRSPASLGTRLEWKAEIIAFSRHVEAIFHEGGRIRTHFVIARSWRV
jgi:hypothetical protein